MAINDDRLAYYKQQLGVSDGSINDLEYRWLASNGATPSSTPDMWRQYLIANGYPASISDGMAQLPYPLTKGAGVVAAIPPVQLVTFSDDFSGSSDGIDLSTRTGWTKLDGGRSAQTTNTASVKHVAGTTPDSAYVCPNLMTNKHYVQCTWQSTANSTTFGLAGRVIDGTNYVAVRRNGTQWQLFKTVGGAFTQLGSSPQEILVGDLIRMEFDGDTVTCYRNGAVFIGSGATVLNAPELVNATRAGQVVRASIAPLISNFSAGGMA